MKNKIENFYNKNFNNDGELYFSPGRVNLIGEHIDYLGGYVLPCSLEIGTYAKIRKREDTKIKIISLNFEQLGFMEFDLNDLVFEEKHDWANYVKGVLIELKKEFNITNGFEGVIGGNIPHGSGLSSSASLEILTCVIAESVNNLKIDRIKMAVLSKQAENQFMGVNCGIMDQFIIAVGKEDTALMLNTDSLEYVFTNIELNDYKIVIGNTKKVRELNESKYNERRSEATKAQEILSKKYGEKDLCNFTLEQLEETRSELTEVLYKRARHAISENLRVKKAFDCLNKGGLELFGDLLINSHVSLQNDYEVSCFELDTMVDLSMQYKAVGSRMTGAGFGGCTVSIVHKDDLDRFIECVTRDYEKKTGLKGELYVASIGSGAKKL